MDLSPENTVTIQKIKVCGFGAFTQERQFNLRPRVNVISGTDEATRTWLLKAISFMFNPRYERKELAMSYAAETDAPASFVRISIKTADYVYVDNKRQNAFSVTRFLDHDRIGNIYYNDSSTHPVPIDRFHLEFPFVVIDEPLISIASAPNEFDLMQLIRNAFGLKATRNLESIAVFAFQNHGNVRICIEIAEHVKGIHDEVKAVLTKLCTMELAMLEADSPKVDEHLRDIETQWPHATRDEMRRECYTDYVKLINQLQAAAMLNDHRNKCLHFNKLQTVVHMLLDKAVQVTAADRQTEKDVNDKIVLALTPLVAVANDRVAVCRTIQLFRRKRQNYLRNITKVADLGIDESFVNNVSGRNNAIRHCAEHLRSFDALMTTEEGWRAFMVLQKEYTHWLAQLGDIEKHHQDAGHEFVKDLEEKYNAMIENLPKEIRVLRLEGEMVKEKVEIIRSISEYFEFFHHETVNGFRLALNVLTDPATDPKFTRDLVGNVMDFIDPNRIDETFEKFVVPVILNVLPTFVFKTKAVGSEFVELMQEKSTSFKSWHCRISCDDNHENDRLNARTTRGFKSLSEILLTDEMRRENRSVDFILGQFLVLCGNMPAAAQNLAIKLRKTLIFPSENYYYTEHGHRVWIHNGTGHEFKNLLNLWHEKIRPSRDRMIGSAQQASVLHDAIAQLQMEKNVDGFCGDVRKLTALNREQKEHFKLCQKILDNLIENTASYLDLCNEQAKLLCYNDARRVRLMVLQNGELTDQGVQAAVAKLTEMIAKERENLDGGYANNVPNMQLTVNRFPLVEQMHIYAKFKAESTRFLPVPVPVEDNGIDGEPVGSEALLKKAEIFEDLWRSDYQSLANQKRLAELKHPSHRELIDAEFLTELRACSNDQAASLCKQFEEEIVAAGYSFPTTGVTYVKTVEKNTNIIESTTRFLRNSLQLYDLATPVLQFKKQNTLRRVLSTLIAVVEKMNGHGVALGENRAIAIRFQTSTKEWIIHRHTDRSEIQMTFDDLLDESMAMNFIYTHVETDEVLVTRVLDMNASAIATLFYLQLGLELNENLLLLNWSIRNCGANEMKFLISRFGHRSNEEENSRQILFVPHVNLDGLFPNNDYHVIHLT